MDPLTTARVAAAPIGTLGGAYMLNRHTRARGDELGFKGWGFYLLGRCGVLGDVEPDVVRAAAVFFPERMVNRFWPQARDVMPAADGVKHYTDVLHAWGRDRLGDFDGAGRLAALAASVADGADVAGLPLFAGWRALPRPDDPPALAAHLMMVLREHRGGVHALAVLGSGLTPLQAVLAGPGGEGNAKWFGWPEPYPDCTALRERWEQAERLTDELAAPAFAALDAAEREELVDLLGQAHQHVSPPRE